MDKFLVILILYLSLIKATFFLPKMPDVLYYGCFIGVFLWLLFRGRQLYLAMAYIPFLLAILLSIGVNDIPAVYQTPLRLAGFCAVAFLVGPFWQNSLLVVFRKRLFVATLWVLEWLTLLSFFCKIAELPFVSVGEDFRGLSNYSMVMGPLAGISFLYCLYLTYASDTKRERFVGIVKAMICLFVVILAGSRAALGASLLGMLFFIGKIYRFQLTGLVPVGIVISILALSTISFWLPMAERMQKKMEYGKEEGSTTASRDLLWLDRLNEFRSYPIFGVGFASYNPDIVQRVGSEDTGTIEPGSSWLFLLSSLGLTGFLSFLLPAVYLFFKTCFSKEDNLRNAFLGSLLILLMAHMFFEGYVISSGAYLCFLLWLFLSECYTRLIKKYDECEINT